MPAKEGTEYLFISLLQARVGSSVMSHLGDIPPEALLQMSPGEFAARLGMAEGACRAFEELRREFDPDVTYGRLAAAGISVLTLAGADYPGRLREAADPPAALFVQGEIPEAVCVALVGARRASPTGIETSRSLARALAGRGVCVVSGLAVGVDAAAHEGALEAGGLTVAVLGCGIDVVYPRSNRELFGRVGAQGALVSEYGPGEPPLAWHFPARNRIIAGLCDVVVVVEAGEKSGALITARHAAESGREVWAVPGPPGVPECRGSNRLLADGAGVLWDVAEFLDTVAPGGATDAGVGVGAEVPAGLPEIEAAVLGGVGFAPAAVDVVARRSGVGMRAVLPALALLELKGYVTRGAGGAYARRAAP